VYVKKYPTVSAPNKLTPVGYSIKKMETKKKILNIVREYFLLKYIIKKNPPNIYKK
jgi:hypothetical protein